MYYTEMSYFGNNCGYITCDFTLHGSNTGFDHVL